MDIKHTLELLEIANRITGIQSLDDLFPVAEKILQFHNNLDCGAASTTTLNYKPTNQFKDIEELCEYFTIQHPIKGAIPLNLFPFQKEYLDWINDGKNLKISCVARQLGFTSIIAVQALWVALTQPNSTILLIGANFVSALETIEKVRFSIQSSKVLMSRSTDFNRGYISFDNGSRIIARACTKNALRGVAPNWTIIQDAVRIPYNTLQDFMQALNLYISEQGGEPRHVVIYGTPKWSEGPFYNIWKDVPLNGYEKKSFTWDCHPHRHTNWQNATSGQLGAIAFSQEHNCQFISKPI